MRTSGTLADHRRHGSGDDGVLTVHYVAGASPAKDGEYATH